jgi:hypothetical protein
MASLQSHTYEKVSEEEDIGLDDHERPPTNKSSKRLYAIICALALGWTLTIAYSYLNHPADNGPLHVYTRTPIPKEVFSPVKKVFDVDPRYVGDGVEINHAWDKLVAGEILIGSKEIKLMPH